MTPPPKREEREMDEERMHEIAKEEADRRIGAYNVEPRMREVALAVVREVGAGIMVGAEMVRMGNRLDALEAAAKHAEWRPSGYVPYPCPNCGTIDPPNGGHACIRKPDPASERVTQIPTWPGGEHDPVGKPPAAPETEEKKL